MGLLSQATNNLIVSLQQLSGLSGLPAPAQAVCNQLWVAISPIGPSINAIQSQATSVVSNIQGSLQQALTLLGQSKPGDPIPPAIATTIQGLTGQIASLNAAVGAAFAPAKNTVAAVPQMSNQLAQIQGSLNQQSSTIQGQLSSQQSSLDSAKKKYYYLLALGPLGLLGLAAALVLYKQLQSNVDSIQNDLNQLQATQSTLNTMIATTNSLQIQIGTVVNRLDGVINTLQLVSDMLETISGDISEHGSLATLQMAFGAAISEVEILAGDFG